jgi:hypothetical protein
MTKFYKKINQFLIDIKRGSSDDDNDFKKIVAIIQELSKEKVEWRIK